MCSKKKKKKQWETVTHSEISAQVNVHRNIGVEFETFVRHNRRACASLREYNILCDLRGNLSLKTQHNKYPVFGNPVINERFAVWMRKRTPAR